MKKAVLPEVSELALPAQMEGATAFEVYVFMHQNDRTIRQIKTVWGGKTIDDIRCAMDKASEQRWPYIPKDQLPSLPWDGLEMESFGMGDEASAGVRIDHGIKHKVHANEVPLAMQRRVYEMAVQGFTTDQIRAETGLSRDRVREYSHGQLKRGRR